MHKVLQGCPKRFYDFREGRLYNFENAPSHFDHQFQFCKDVSSHSAFSGARFGAPPKGFEPSKMAKIKLQSRVGLSTKNVHGSLYQHGFWEACPVENDLPNAIRNAFFMTTSSFKKQVKNNLTGQFSQKSGGLSRGGVY